MLKEIDNFIEFNLIHDDDGQGLQLTIKIDHYSDLLILPKEDAQQLINELQELVNQMKDE